MTESQLIDLAIDPDHRDQFHSRLKDPRTRRKILNKLNSGSYLHRERTTWFSKFVKPLAELRVEPEAPVYLLSLTSKLDRQTLTFADALVKVPLAGWPTIIGISETLALYYGELGESAAIIRRTRD